MLTRKRKALLKKSYQLMPFRPISRKPGLWSLLPVRFDSESCILWRVAWGGFSNHQLLFRTARKAYVYAKSHKPINTTVDIRRDMIGYWTRNSIARNGWGFTN